MQVIETLMPTPSQVSDRKALGPVLADKNHKAFLVLEGFLSYFREKNAVQRGQEKC